MQCFPLEVESDEWSVELVPEEPTIEELEDMPVRTKNCSSVSGVYQRDLL